MLGQARVETRKLVWETGLYLVENSDSRVLILVLSWILGLREKVGGFTEQVSSEPLIGI